MSTKDNKTTFGAQTTPCLILSKIVDNRDDDGGGQEEEEEEGAVMTAKA